MTRLTKVLGIAGLASVYLMQTPCTFAQHGFSILPSFTELTGINLTATIAGFFSGLTGGITGT